MQVQYSPAWAGTIAPSQPKDRVNQLAMKTEPKSAPAKRALNRVRNRYGLAVEVVISEPVSASYLPVLRENTG